MSDYRRPADYQVVNHYECQSCGATAEMESCYGMARCSCGGTFAMVGESYPASSEDWDEQRDTQDGNWHNRQPRY